MRYQQYLLQEGRSKNITEEKAISLIQKNCKQAVKAYKDGYYGIYRGVRENGDFLYVDPKQGKPRKSANTSNYYTLLIDNSFRWKPYPKRSESLICTTNPDGPTGYGNIFLVFPYDNHKIGQCPTFDFWYSFYDLETDLSNYNGSLKTMMRIENIEFNDNSYKDIVQSFKTFDVHAKDRGIPETKKKYVDLGAKWMRFYQGDLLRTTDDLLDPDMNDFALVKTIRNLDKNREVWTDSKCILISTRLSDLLHNIINK